MFLLDFVILKFEVGPDRKRESNVKINPLGLHHRCERAEQQYTIGELCFRITLHADDPNKPHQKQQNLCG